MKKLIEKLNESMVESEWGAVGALSQALSSGRMGLHILLNPVGTWSFKGNVPMELAYERKDGNPLTDEDKEALDNVRKYSVPGGFKRWKVRMWPTREAAIKEAKQLGYKVANEKEKDKTEDIDASKGVLDFVLTPNGELQVGLGGEWWNGRVPDRPGQEAVFHHRKEGVDPGYQPVTVRWTKSGNDVLFTLDGGFLGAPCQVLVGVKRVDVPKEA